MAERPEQLTLVDAGSREWRLDEETKEAGRRGIAAARRMLERTAPHTTAPRRPTPSRPRAA